MDVSDNDGMASGSRAQDNGSEGTIGYGGWSARRLVVGSHRIFISRDQRDPIAVSLEYRGLVYWALCSIDREESASLEDTEAVQHDEDVFHDGLTDFYHVWTLAEAFLLDSSCLPAMPLLRWLKMYCVSTEDESGRYDVEEVEGVVVEARAAGQTPALALEYWKAVRYLVINVLPSRAAAMLRCHPKGLDNSSEVGSLARHLEKMPLLLPEATDAPEDELRVGSAEGADDLNREEFLDTWAVWHKGCEAAAATFGVVVGSDHGISEGVRDGWAARIGGGEERGHLRWLWGAICGEHDSLREGTDTWSGLLAATLAYRRPDIRKVEVASVLRECTRTHPPHSGENFLVEVITDASVGAVGAIVRFARERGDTLALASCSAHLVDLLSRENKSRVTNSERSYFLHRLADRLKASPWGGWELAAVYLGAATSGSTSSMPDGNEKAMGTTGRRASLQTQGRDSEGKDADKMRLLREMAVRVVPESERATHELLEWCRVNGLGEATADEVCRARGLAWMDKAGLLPGQGAQAEERGASAHGACAKAAYWLAKGGGGVQLERLCSEISERLILHVARAGDTSDKRQVQEAQKSALFEAEGVLAAIPPSISGAELLFLERYEKIADLLIGDDEGRSESMEEDSPASCARAAGLLAIELLAPRAVSGSTDADATSRSTSPSARERSTPHYPPPTRSWAHLLRLAVPALNSLGTGTDAGVGGIGGDSRVDASPVSLSQVHTLLAKLQRLEAGQHRVGAERGSSFMSQPARAAYGFDDGREALLEVRRALVRGLSGAMMAQNAQERLAGPHPEDQSRRKDKVMAPTNWLSAGILMSPRVSVKF